MKQRFLSIFLALSLIVPFLPQITLPAKAAETTAKTQDENSNENTDAFGIKMDTTIDTQRKKRITLMEQRMGESFYRTGTVCFTGV